jgi:hypothetical protein
MNKKTKLAIGGVSLILLIAAWSQGTFDNFLWRVHLNYNTCGQNGFGAVFCGDDMKAYEKRMNTDCEYNAVTDTYSNKNYPGESC